MKQSKIYIPMLKEVSNKAVCQSHILALRAGLIHQTAAGIYSYLPLATLMLEKIEAIIRKELLKIGANEVILPLLEPSELWQQTGRWQGYGSELFRVYDRKDAAFALAPTHEEVMTELVKNYLITYKKYPVNLFQIATKMRDEARPRYGLLRGREFIMMDGYSFHTSLASLNETYDDYYQAYCHILDTIGLNYRIVKADNGKIGGTSSHEFMALANIGEDTIAYVDNQKEAYNVEIAPVYYENKNIDSNLFLPLEMINTPECRKCEAVSAYLNTPLQQHIKAIAIENNTHDGVIMFLIRADRELNEIKAQRVSGGDDFIMASSSLLAQFNLVEGYMGPIGASEQVIIYADNEVADIVNGVMGANQENMHYQNVNFRRDVNNVIYQDLRSIEAGDYFTKDLGPVKLTQGIEIGHIFALGDKYTKDMKMTYLDEKQQSQIPLMGCYGIGVSRLISAIIEQNNDAAGIIMPKAIAPFQIHIIIGDVNNENQNNYAHELEQNLESLGYSVLVDDRNINIGTKFKEADLIGLPLRIVIGRDFVNQKVDVKYRNSDDAYIIDIKDVINYIKDTF